MRLISAAKALSKRHPAGVLQRSAYYFIFPTVVMTVTVQIMILRSTRFQEYSSWSWDPSEKTLPNFNNVADHALQDSLMPVCMDPCLWKAGIDGSWEKTLILLTIAGSMILLGWFHLGPINEEPVVPTSHQKMQYFHGGQAGNGLIINNALLMSWPTTASVAF